MGRILDRLAHAPEPLILAALTGAFLTGLGIALVGRRART